MKKRYLAICRWDKDPFAYGDVLTFNTYHCMRLDLKEFDTDEMDVIVTKGGPLKDNVACTDMNFYYYFSKLLPLFFMNRKLHNLYIVEDLEEFLEENKDNYFIDYEDYHKFWIGQVNKSKLTGYIPRVYVNTAISLWVGKFIKENIWPNYMTTVHLRNDNLQEWRNGSIDEWLKFFSFLRDIHPQYKVVLVGEQEEIDNRMRNLSNILISKDYGTTSEQDMALIKHSTLFMGVASGPATMAVYTEVPYLIFKYKCPELPENTEKYPWATSSQKLIWKEEIYDTLVSNFIKIESDIDKYKWEEGTKKLIVLSNKNFRRKYMGVELKGLGA